MKLTFRIRYRTVWGENLRIILNEEENNSIPLTTRDGVIWQNSYEYFTTDIEKSNHLPIWRFPWRNLCPERVRSHSSFILFRQCPANALYSG